MAEEHVILDGGIVVILNQWEPPGIEWTWCVGDKSGGADSREAALFYAGWWAGRHDLLEDMTRLVGGTHIVVERGD